MMKINRFLCIIGLMLLLALPKNVLSAATPEASFGGQYRLNAYTLDDGNGAGELSAIRARIRQNIDLKFSEQFDTHLQINIGHIRTGVFNHNLSHSGDPSFGIRHAVINYHFSEALNITAGIVPASDKLNDTLFSSDWDFNPLAIVVHGKTAGMMSWRVGYFKVTEGDEVDKSGSVDLIDDADGILIDIGTSSQGIGMGIAGLLIITPDQQTLSGGKATEDVSNYWIGVLADADVNGIKVQGHVVYGSVDRGTLNTTTGDDNTGVQVRLSADGSMDKHNWGIMGLYTSGDTGGTGFITPQTIYGGQGYWGKTGILNVQGPTDTGMDANMLRTDNAGYGLWTIQGSLGTSFTEEWSAYGAVSYFKAIEEGRASTTGKDIGTDLYAQVKYAFPNAPLALEVGVDFADLGQAHYNSGGVDRDAWAVFSRLQAEF